MKEELFRKSRWQDIVYLTHRLRQWDKLECYAMGVTPFEALMHGLYSSKPCFTLLEPDGTPAAMLGVSPDGAIWLLGTDAIERLPMTFLRRCRLVLTEAFKRSGKDRLFNYVCIGNEVHIKWLKWLGFDISPTVTMINDVPFYYFERKLGN